MKHLITSIACVMLLMTFLMQFAQNQVLFQKLMMVHATVDAYAQEEERLKQEISRIMDCDGAAVSVMEEEDYMEVMFPIEKVLASPDFWGVDEADNRADYVIRREKTEAKK